MCNVCMHFRKNITYIHVDVNISSKTSYFFLEFVSITYKDFNQILRNLQETIETLFQENIMFFLLFSFQIVHNQLPRTVLFCSHDHMAVFAFSSQTTHVYLNNRNLLFKGLKKEKLLTLFIAKLRKVQRKILTFFKTLGAYLKT